MTVGIRGVRSALGNPAVRRRIVIALWVVAAAAAALRVGAMLADPILPGDPWQSNDGHFKDFRDVVWAPGRFLLSGGNPYDPVPYLAAFPWAQQFSPYPPVWLLFGVVLGPLPYFFAGVTFQVLALGVAVVLLRVLCTWALPRWADLAVPIGMIWLNVWFPGRGSLSSLGSVLAVLGVVLVLRSVTRADRRDVDVACAVGVGIALVKPQFGVLALVIAVAGGRIREAWRGVVGMVLACVPVLVAVSIAAGGPIQFAQSVLRNVTYVNGTNTPGGLGSPFQRRFDLLGALADLGLTSPPAWLLLTIPTVAVVLTVLVLRRTRDPLVVTTVASTAILLGFFHPWYDVLLILVPATIGLGMALRGDLPDLGRRLVFGACAFVVVHLHTVSTALIPGYTVPAADMTDVAVVVVALVAAVVVAFTSARRRPEAATDAAPAVSSG